MMHQGLTISDIVRECNDLLETLVSLTESEAPGFDEVRAELECCEGELRSALMRIRARPIDATTIISDMSALRDRLKLTLQRWASRNNLIH